MQAGAAEPVCLLLIGHPDYTSVALRKATESGRFCTFDPLTFLREYQTGAKRHDPLAEYLRANHGTDDNDEIVAAVVQKLVRATSERGMSVVIANWPLSSNQLQVSRVALADQKVKVVEIGSNTVFDGVRRDLQRILLGRQSAEELPKGYTQVSPETEDAVEAAINLVLFDVALQHDRFPFVQQGKVTMQDIDPFPETPLDQIARRAYAWDAAKAVQVSLQCAESNILVRQFCGTHPVSLTVEDFETLRTRPYAVSRKLDGVRYFLLIMEGTMWFVDRSARVWEGPSHPGFKAFERSMLDVEVCGFDRELSIVVLDVIRIRGNCTRGLSFYARLGAGKELVSFLRSCCERHFDIRTQKYMSLGNVAPPSSSTDKRYDGLVFTPIRSNYRLGKNDRLLKWKPEEQNTVDVLCMRQFPFTAFALDGDEYVEVGVIPEPPNVDHAVVECSVISAGGAQGYRMPPEYAKWKNKYAPASPKPTYEETGAWADVEDESAAEDCFVHKPVFRVQRVRTDKTQPNIISTFERIMDSFEECITAEQLEAQVLRHPAVIAAAARDAGARRARTDGRWGPQRGSYRRGRGAQRRRF